MAAEGLIVGDQAVLGDTSRGQVFRSLLSSCPESPEKKELSSILQVGMELAASLLETELGWGDSYGLHSAYKSPLNPFSPGNLRFTLSKKEIFIFCCTWGGGG